MIVTDPEAIADGTGLTVGDASQFPTPVAPAPLAGTAVAPVPEPGTLALFSAAVCGAAVYRRLHSRRNMQ